MMNDQSTKSALIVANAQTVECNLDADVPIQTDLLLTLFGSPELFKPEEVTALEQAVVRTYNTLVFVESACRQGNRSITSASMVTNVTEFGGASSDVMEREFTLSLRLEGTCRGCPNNPGLFVEDTRDLANPTDTCPCEAPSEARFATALQSEAEELRAARNFAAIVDVTEVAELRPVTCAAELTPFSAAVIVELIGATTLTADDQNTLAIIFAQTYNRINGFNDLTCDPFFRRIDSVAVSLDTDLGRRKLSKDVDVTDPTNAHRVLEDTDDFFDGVDFIEPDIALRFEILARCRGCNPQTTFLFDLESAASAFDRRLSENIDSALKDEEFLAAMTDEKLPPRARKAKQGPRSLVQTTGEECRCVKNPESRARYVHLVESK